MTCCCAEAEPMPKAPSQTALNAPKLKSRLNKPLRFMTTPSFQKSSTSPLMVVSHLSKSVQDATGTLDILRDIDFELSPQQSLAIVGASGSGKSTLLSIMAGLDTPTQGTVYLGGVDMFAMDEDARAALRARQVGFVFQSFQLLGNMTALENVMLPLELAGVPNPRVAAKDMLVRVGLGERLGHYPKVLSGGEQQRVALARAFVVKPALLLADEPTGSLDHASGERIMDLMFELNKELGTTLVLVTHDLKLAAKCDQAITIEAGKIKR
jgi:putative ABC transport system ATP-binding protein